MRILLCVIVLALCGCCHTQPPPQCPEMIAQSSPPPDPSIEAKRKVVDAWMDAANEEIVASIAGTDPKLWAHDAARKVILAETHELSLYIRKAGVFFRMTVFEDGRIFLDEELRPMLRPHRDRLAAFYKRVEAAKRQP